MQAIIEKMNGYLKMEDELEFGEFSAYYKEVMDLLQKEYQNFGKEDLIKISAVLQIVAANAMDRSGKKDANSKKFKKMCEKGQFWLNAIEMRMHKEFGMNKQDLEIEIDEVFADAE